MFQFAITLSTLKTGIASLLVLFFLFCGSNLIIKDCHAEESVISYVSTSIDNQEIRLINPNGTQDRTLWRTPSEGNVVDGIGTLSWKPDGTELLFDSGHNWQRSMAIRDLYAISPNGTGLRRVTRPPGPEGSANLPTGTVTFLLNAFEQGGVQVYVDGAKEPVNYFARSAEDYQITVEVADWGGGVRQFIRLLDPDPLSFVNPCNFSEEGWVDVVPGQVTDYGTVRFSPAGDVYCPRLFSPSWSQDGSHILYLGRPIGGAQAPFNNIRQIDAQAPASTVGSLVLDSNTLVTNDLIYRAVFAPIAERRNELLFLLDGSALDPIYHTTTENPAKQELVHAGPCPLTQCEIFDIAWLVDGSGFVFAQWESDLLSLQGVSSEQRAVLYRSTFENKTAVPILELLDEFIGKLAISPDGKTIVFERGSAKDTSVDIEGHGSRLQCPCSLWIVNMDGSGLRQLITDGKAPAWGRVAAANTEVDRSRVDRLFDWAEAEFRQYFPSHQTSQDVQGYYARYFPATDIYLGVQNNRVYVFGAPFGGLLDVGDLEGWLQQKGF